MECRLLTLVVFRDQGVLEDQVIRATTFARLSLELVVPQVVVCPTIRQVAVLALTCLLLVLAVYKIAPVVVISTQRWCSICPWLEAEQQVEGELVEQVEVLVVYIPVHLLVVHHSPAVVVTAAEVEEGEAVAHRALVS